MGQAYIGSVNLRYPLAWQEKSISSIDVGKIGADIRTMTGDMVFIRGATLSGTKPREATLLFNWESQATIEALDALWKAGSTIVCDFEGNGIQYYFKFAVEDGISDVEHAGFGSDAVHYYLYGYDTDIYKGKIHGYIISVVGATTTTTSSTSTSSTSSSSTTTTEAPQA